MCSDCYLCHIRIYSITKDNIFQRADFPGARTGGFPHRGVPISRGAHLSKKKEEKKRRACILIGAAGDLFGPRSAAAQRQAGRARGGRAAQPAGSSPSREPGKRGIPEATNHTLILVK